jgi:aarF domain-containing kinase
MPTLSQLIDALPQQEEDSTGTSAAIPPLAEASMIPVPIGRIRRIGLLASLQSKIAAGYLFYWLRGWFADAEQRQRILAETNWRTAFRLLDSMGYLRGATLKAGQFLASFPDVVPEQFIETLDRLHSDAPPMHFSLLRELFHNELGEDPEKLFASFEKRAFAAASLGQVHRAQLHSGEPVAVKIQYPGIARAIREDFANLGLFLLPARLTADWESTKEQFQDLRTRLDWETDYQREADMLQTARALYRDDDGIVIPRVYRDHSTARVLTMERLTGKHLTQFLATDPSQHLRNEFGRKIMRAWYRMHYAARLLYLDCNPGNFLFMDDGRLGVIDFGCMLPLDDAMWDLFRRMDRPLTTGDRAQRISIMKEWSAISDGPADIERLRIMDDLLDWFWRPRYHGGEFDFGDEAEFRRGINLFTEATRKRYTRGQPTSPVITRQQFALRGLLYRLNAKFDIAPLAEEEVQAAGWDRTAYAAR